jgi:protein involved in polysaccharide export with SLBB domain
MVSIGKFGSAKVGGLRVSAAAVAIGSQFRRAAKTSAARLTVHIAEVNGTRIVRVGGGVVRPGVVLLGQGMSVKDAIGAAGGKRGGAGAGFVYVSSRGVRRTLVIDGVTGGDPESETKLRAGDVVEVPVGL